MIFYGLTDKGRMRPQNEDFLFASDLPVGGLPNLFAVADGMGGHNAGEYASECAIEALLECLRRENEKDPVRALSSAVSFANEKVYDIGARDPSKAGMGTTIVCAVFEGDTLTVMNVGDSRLYAAGDNFIRLVTRDHSVVEELVRIGALSEEAAEFHKDRHKITRAVGAERRVIPDFFTVDMKKEGVSQLLLCTDGLSNELTGEELFSILKAPLPIKERAKRLVNAANENHGADNITALIVEPYSEVDYNG
ncbi:MAG: Stp1/IreP family PP2C-type Ser/Thr phosphatase [Lachnospiraceae bacterium]|nr:Stp1/IreP family PP2C-type Ser/Thr phosphatase [Lachnospiraceae bacterium]MBQ6258691.1 Stp1/IreP family PP2C-type Ser/Thr phosphatase [Lachnospiraceae bacterium]